MLARLLAVTPFALATCLLSSCRVASPGAVAPNGEPYTLVWSDEFDGDGPLDPAHWSYETGFVRNQELQWYQPENARRVNGMLVIEGRREHRPNPRYVAPSTTDAARIRSSGSSLGCRGSSDTASVTDSAAIAARRAGNR